MIETTIKLIKYGIGLRLRTKVASVRGQVLTPEIVEKSCRTLRNKYGVAAVTYSTSGQYSLLVAVDKIGTMEIQGDEWYVEIADTGETKVLKFYRDEDVSLLAALLERCLLIEIEKRTNLWKLDSPRIWYEQNPFDNGGEIVAYRRYKPSVVPIEGVGLGISLHVGTSFFTELSIDDYLGDHLPDDIKTERESRFNFLSQRQRGAKGTLLYDLGTSKLKCYFEKFQRGITCATTGPIVIDGYRYNSLIDYYRKKRKNVLVQDDSRVVYVSFPGWANPKPVAAHLVRLRVMNETLPQRLKRLDKIRPNRRNKYIEDFWEALGPDPLGKGKPSLEEGLWIPDEKRQVFFTMPSIKYSNGNILQPPMKIDQREYKNYFWQRRQFLKEKKCYHIPKAIDRRIYFALPQMVNEEMGKRLSDDLVDYISTCTGKEFYKEPFHYSSIGEAVKKLYPKNGCVVFVFDREDPATYFNIAYQLKAWRTKRITYGTLEDRYKNLKAAEAETSPEDKKPPQGVRDWNSFIELSAQDVIQMMEIIPFVVNEQFPYEGQLAIDVGEQRRYFSISLLICRGRGQPDFYLRTAVSPKADHKSEVINKIHLRDEIVGVFKKIGFKKFDPLKSLLILRDGGVRGGESEGIKNAISELISLKFLEYNAIVHGVDFHKSSQKEIRFWDKTVNAKTKRINVMEGTGTLIGSRTVVLSNTGRGTITQGTTEPVAITVWDDPMNQGIDIKTVAFAVFISAQFNWGSPGKAQRLPIYFKRTDEELKKKQTQEIRRIS